MIKLLITGDWHYRGTNPRARTDNYEEAITNKLLEVFEIAEKHNVEGILVPGDITDSPNLSITTMVNLITLLRKAKCPICTIPGNHDECAASIESLKRTPYGLLQGIEVIEDLADPYVRISKHFGEKKDVVITGKGYNVDTDRGIDDYLISDEVRRPIKIMINTINGAEKPAVWIHMAHGMLLESPPGYDLMRYTLMNDVANDPKAPDILVCGHEHTGFGVKRIKDTLFINPGAICRLSAHPAEIERKIQVCLLTIHDTALGLDGVETELIPLKSARPGHEVLSREHLEKEAEREQMIEDFMALLAEEGEAKFLETREIIENIAGREAIPKDVVDEALKRIGEAKEALKV